MDKTNVFTAGIQRIKNAIHRPLWRTVYVAMYKLSQYQDLSNNDLASALAKLGLLYSPHQRRTHKLARNLRNALFESIIQNGNIDQVWNYHILDTTQRITFARDTLLSAHQILSQNDTPTYLKLRDVFFDTYYDAPFGGTTMGYYIPSDGAIGLCAESLMSDNISDLIYLLSHEYTHVQQMAFKSTLPRVILRALEQRYDANQKVPYLLRIDEREANRIGHLVAKNFIANFQDYLSK